MDTSLILAVAIPSSFVLSLVVVVIVFLCVRRQRRHSLGIDEIEASPNAALPPPTTVSLTKASFTSRNYDNYGITIPSATYSPTKKAHYATFSSIHHQRGGSASTARGTSIVLPPNALNMHNKNMASRSTLNLDGLVHQPGNS